MRRTSAGRLKSICYDTNYLNPLNIRVVINYFYTTFLRKKSKNPSPLVYSAFLALPVSIFWVLYYKVPKAWWVFDDTAHLKGAIEHGILPHFYQPHIWKLISPANLTPWLQLSYGLDFYFFGLYPSGFYYHHLFAFSLTILFGYIALCRFFSPLISALSLSIFVASVPCATIVQLLMTRHYLEGLALSCIAFLFYINAVDKRKILWSCLGSIFYLLAVTTKEIYVPLAVILPFFPIDNVWRRIKMSLPFILVLAFYVFWRAYMLGFENLFTGYGDIYGKPDWEDFVNFPFRVAEIMGWHAPWQWIVLTLVMISFLGYMIRVSSMNKWIWMLVVGSVTILPVMPVLPILSPRYLFLPFFLSVIIFAIALKNIIIVCKKSNLSYIAVASLGLLLLMSGIKSVQASLLLKQMKTTMNHYRTIGEFILYGETDNTLLITSFGSGWYYGPLLWLREHVLNKEQGATICNDLCVCKKEDIKSAYHFENGVIQRIDIAKINKKTSCGNTTADLIVDMYFSPDSKNIHWKFGPYKEGRYFFVEIPEKKNVHGFFSPVPSSGKFPHELSKELNFVIKYFSPDGWYTYSSVLTLRPNKEQKETNVNLHWERES